MRTRSSTIATTIADTIERVRDSGLAVDSIGIATPGVVDVEANDVESGFLSRLTDSIVYDVARQLAMSARRRAVEQVLDVSLDEAGAALYDRIFVDNDVRCAMRAHQYLAHRHGARPANALCVNIGRGVGASFAINGQIHYGSSWQAGRIEKIRPVTSPESDGRSSALTMEQILSCQGLARVACDVDRQMYRAWMGQYVARHRDELRYHYGGDKAAWARRFAEDCEGGLPFFLTQPKEGEMRYAREVRDRYGELLAASLASLVWLLDPNDVMVYGGTIHKLLAETAHFKDDVETRLRLLAERSVRFKMEVQVGWEWQGAALRAFEARCGAAASRLAASHAVGPGLSLSTQG